MHLPVQQQQHIRVLRLSAVQQDMTEQLVLQRLPVKLLDPGQVYLDVLSKVNTAFIETRHINIY